MNFRILAASVWPRGRVFALLAATALTRHIAGPGAQAQQPAPAPGGARAHAKGGAQGRAEGRPESRSGRAGRPAGAAGRGCSRRRRPAAGPAGSADLCALDQILPEGPGCQRQAGLLHRQGRPHRVRPAGHRRRHHRARRRAEEDPARHAAARHAARSRHPRHRRQQPAAAEPLCDLLRQRLHVGLRGDAGTARQHEEGAESGGAGDQLQRRAADAAAAAGRIRQGL